LLGLGMARRTCVEAEAIGLTRHGAPATLQSSCHLRKSLLWSDVGEMRALQNRPFRGGTEALALLTSFLIAPPLHRTATCLPTRSALNPSPVNHNP
jgi:hypothetical protein